MDMSPAEFAVWDREFKERPIFGAERLLAQILLVLITANTSKEHRKDIPEFNDLVAWTFYPDEREEMNRSMARKDYLKKIERGQRVGAMVAAKLFGLMEDDDAS